MKCNENWRTGNSLNCGEKKKMGNKEECNSICLQVISFNCVIVAFFKFDLLNKIHLTIACQFSKT